MVPSCLVDAAVSSSQEHSERLLEIELSGNDLTLEQLIEFAHRRARPAVAPAALARVDASRELLEKGIAAAIRGEADEIYGVTTGFGNFKNRRIPAEEHTRHQRNLIRSHCAGAGLTTDADDPGNVFPPEVMRAAMVLRLNSLLSGHSGPRRLIVERLLAFLRADILPEVPLRGSVGASGDLCPLSHIALGLLGEGRARIGGGPLAPTAELLRDAGIDVEIELQAKEGLALINGTAITTALTALAVHAAEQLAETADLACAMTLEAVGGRLRALDPRVHQARGQPGQLRSARRILDHLEGSRLANLAADRQDPYSIRCAPQVHGASRGAIAHCRSVVETELNAASDNPLLFDNGADAADAQSAKPEVGPAYSAGNFHAQPIALAADYLAIAVAELGSISERRTQLLLDANHNRGLPSNLATRPGLNSGLLLVQYLAAATVSENKVLCHPASVDSIPTASNAEDHVSMGTHGARQARMVCQGVETILAVELFAAAQALDWRLHALAHGLAGEPPPAGNATAAPDAAELDTSLLGRGTRRAHARVRDAIPFVDEDRVLAGDLRALRGLVESGHFAFPPGDDTA